MGGTVGLGENEGRTRERAAEGVGESGREEAEGGLGGFH
jgi:hypothetical protein